MTLFLTTDIPDEIQTIEQLLVWGSEILQYLYPNTQVTDSIDSNGDPQKSRVIESNKFFFTATETGVWRHAARHLIDLDNNHLATGRLWNHAKSLGNGVIPVEMKS